VVLKAHPAHPNTSDLVAGAIGKALVACGEHPHVFQHVHAPSFEAGKSLVQHPLTKAVGFTGSFSGGKALYDYATVRKEPIPVFAEMGSINPVFILPGALKVRKEKVAEMYAASITQGVGQFCTNPGLMLSLESKELEEFKQQLAAKIKAVAPATMLHPGIAENFLRNRGKALKEKGVSLVAESDTKAGSNQGIPTVATVAAADFLANPALVEEVFGPYSLLVVSKSKDELFRALDAIPGQLTATIIGEESELSEYKDFIQKVGDRVGRLVINGVPTGVEVCPSMHHGGPFPATTDSRFTSVGTDAAKRWVRPLSFQNFPHDLLPAELQDKNPLNIWRLFNNTWTK
jgi:NADP-dependent aldehyde dehydrogenase